MWSFWPMAGLKAYGRTVLYVLQRWRSGLAAALNFGNQDPNGISCNEVRGYSDFPDFISRICT